MLVLLSQSHKVPFTYREKHRASLPWAGLRFARFVCRYQRYLESVLEVADEYQEIQDLLMRHATLQATNDDLRHHQRQSAAEAEEVRVALQTCTKQKTDEILNLNNRLAQLKKQLESYEQQASLQVRLYRCSVLLIEVVLHCCQQAVCC